MIICAVCGITNPRAFTKGVLQLGRGYCIECKSCYNKARYKINCTQARARSQKVNKARRVKQIALKQRCVDSKGGKCIKCGYNRCLKALHLHHTDPKIKKIGISKAINKGYTWEMLKPELDKTELYCATCHMEIHAD